jgi:hypothetical protein
MRNVSRWGDTDVFPKPIDNHVIADVFDGFYGLLRAHDQDFKNKLAAAPPPTVKAATPVGYSGFRWATQIDPIWNAQLLAEVLDLAERIEETRLGEEVVFSHRLDPDYPDDRLFREDGYRRFVEASQRLAGNYEFVVSTDIADFYARANHHPLENAIEALPKQSGAAKRIIGILGAISRGRSYGLPIGGPGARILAELLLNRVDRQLFTSQIVFTRFADDYRLFAQSEDEAHSHLATLSDLLSSNEGLALQKSKTRVLSRHEFEATLSLPRPHGPPLSSAELKARKLLSFSLRFDPYSDDPVTDYERLESEVDKLDLVDLFSVELNKTRVDPQFTKKLLRAIQYAKPNVKGSIAESLCLNLPLLAPVYPQVMGAIKGLWNDLTVTARGRVTEELVRLQANNSYLLRPGISRAYTVRVLAGDDSQESEQALVALYNDPGSDAAVRRDVILAMAGRKAHWWLSGLLGNFDNLRSPAERRAFLISTAVMTEEAKHFLRRRRKSLSDLENLTCDWARSKHDNDSEWIPAI